MTLVSGDTRFLMNFFPSLSPPFLIPLEECRKMHVNSLLLEELLIINRVIVGVFTYLSLQLDVYQTVA